MDAMVPTDGKWRALRRGAHEILTMKAAMDHRPIQDAESSQLMYDILTSPKVPNTSPSKRGLIINPLSRIFSTLSAASRPPLFFQ
jgi:hypothetical protein